MERRAERDAQGVYEEYEEFYLPIERALSQKRQFRCRHCGASYPTELAVDCCWPDRRYGSKRGLVVICKNCGCRQSLENAPILSGGDNGSRRNKRPGTNWLPALMLVLLVVATIAAILLLYTNGNHIFDVRRNDSDAAGRNSSDTGADAADESDSAALIQPAQMEDIGNLFINISEGGLMQIVGNRVYYTNPEDDYRIYSMDLSFQDSRMECDIPAFYLNVRDDILVFSGAEEGEKYLYRMEPDSGEVILLSEQNTYEPKVVGDTIFYDDEDEKYSLYRCDLDGSNQRRISPGAVFYSCIVDDTIYYLDTQDSYHLYSMDTDGGNKQVLLNQSVRELSALGDTLYLSLSEGGILSYKIDTGAFQRISDLSVSSMVAAEDGWLYFAHRDRGEYLYKMTVGGDDLTKLSNEPVAFINVVSNLISFENKDTGTFYWMLTDGSNYQQIQ